MWSARALGSGAALLLLLALSACQVRPLYSTAPGAGASPQFELPAISVDPPVNREEQIFRNALNFALDGGGGPTAPRYHLIYRLTMRETEVAVGRRTGTPNSYQLNGAVSFLLQDTSSGQQVVGASVTAIDSYNRSTQAFANVRAQRDAEERLLQTLAQLVQARLAAYFATH